MSSLIYSRNLQYCLNLGFEWADGTPLDFTNWADGEPNDYGDGEDCGEMFFSERDWNDISCNSYRSWVCKIPKCKYRLFTVWSRCVGVWGGRGTLHKTNWADGEPNDYADRG